MCSSDLFENWCAAVQAVVRPEEVRHLINFGLRTRPSNAFDTFAMDVATFVGNHRYIPDPEECDRWCSPRGTLDRGGGDCDDLAVLGLSLLLAGGTHADLMVGRWDNTDGQPNHAWIEGRDEFGFFHIEATSGRLTRGGRPSGYHAHYQLHPERCFDIRPRRSVAATPDWMKAAAVAGLTLLVGGALVAAIREAA